ncbi:MAG TPA: fumarylacetoacetate hydrolase family protein [Solirubrobacteraceae bacterium]|nr:fumarylacetoacetate hydrolase family protein [Solirubrobacteraceae bacterium]
MRLVTYDDGSGAQAGIQIGEHVICTAALGAPARSLRALLEALSPPDLAALGERAQSAGRGTPLADVRLLPPVPDPQKIICLGLNYRDHAAEVGQPLPGAPMWFAKFANSLVGHEAEIVLPSTHPDHVDYEAELAVVIGRSAKRIDEQDALDHIAGAMAFNDVSARDLQFENPLWTAGKALDTFAPCGPALVTLDELDDLQALALRAKVNGKTVQEGTTANMIFSVAATIAWLSRTMTLLPGDIIATGTPAGVGAARGSFLRAGDSVEIEVSGIGTLRNRVRAP